MSKDEKAKTGWLRPRRRAVDRAAVRSYGNHFGQLALRRKVARDVPALCGVEAEVCRSLARIENNCPSLEFVAHEVERRNEIRIAGDYDKSISGICVGVAEKRGGEIYVRPLLLHLYHMYKAVCGCGTMLAPGIHGWYPCLVLVVVAFDDLHATMRNDGLKIDVLAFNRSGVVRICLGSGYEVLYCNELVTCVKSGMDKHCADKRGYVKPFAGWTPAQQPMVEIAAVNICCRFHFVSVKKRGSQALRPKTPFRVGRALRLDVNLLRGSARIVSNRIFRNKWGNSFSEIRRFGGFPYGVHIFVSMSGMLDLSKDEKATCLPELQRRRKHFLPRWLEWGWGRLRANGTGR